VNPYESEELLAQYLLFHYGKANEQLPYETGPLAALHFPMRCVQEALRVAGKTPKRALDLGCAVGGASFELARTCAEVVGIDLSNRFIEAAQVLQKEGIYSYQRKDEGDLSTLLEAVIPDEVERERIKFMTGDACSPDKKLGKFDLVLMANLIDRLPRPAECLKHMKDVVEHDGLLAITSPYTWMKEFTPKSNWLGGRVELGQTIRTMESMKWLLGPHFQLIGTKDIPFLIREHSRKYQWSVAEASFWRRKPAEPIEKT